MLLVVGFAQPFCPNAGCLKEPDKRKQIKRSNPASLTIQLSKTKVIRPYFLSFQTLFLTNFTLHSSFPTFPTEFHFPRWFQLYILQKKKQTNKKNRSSVANLKRVRFCYRTEAHHTAKLLESLRTDDFEHDANVCHWKQSIRMRNRMLCRFAHRLAMEGDDLKK